MSLPTVEEIGADKQVYKKRDRDRKKEGEQGIIPKPDKCKILHNLYPVIFKGKPKEA